MIKIFKKLLFSSELIVFFMLLESFFISYIINGYFNFFQMIILFFSFLGIFALIGLIFKAFDIKITPKKDRNIKSYTINLKTKKNIAVLALLLFKVVVTIIFVILNAPRVVFWITISFFDIFTNKFISEIGNNKWLIWNQVVYTFVRFMIYARGYLLIDWVIICIILYIGITILMNINLDYIYLNAFIPDIIYIIVVYNTPFLFYVTLLSFAISLYLYVFSK